MAGTGADTRPNRIFNPVRQAHRFDPHGDYVRRYVPELAGIAGGAVHEPWLLTGTLDAAELWTTPTASWTTRSPPTSSVSRAGRHFRST